VTAPHEVSGTSRACHLLTASRSVYCYSALSLVSSQGCSCCVAVSPTATWRSSRAQCSSSSSSRDHARRSTRPIRFRGHLDLRHYGQGGARRRRLDSVSGELGLAASLYAK